MPDLRPSLTPALAAFGTAATVTPPGGSPVATTVIWLPPVAVDTPGVLQPMNTPQPVLALPRADVPTVARGTLIYAPETVGGTSKTWIVEAILGQTSDETRVLVIPDQT